MPLACSTAFSAVPFGSFKAPSAVSLSLLSGLDSGFLGAIAPLKHARVTLPRLARCSDVCENHHGVSAGPRVRPALVPARRRPRRRPRRSRTARLLPGRGGPYDDPHRCSGTFLPGTAPDWAYVPVDVPRGVRAIEVSYSYDRPEPNLPSGTAGNTLDLGVFGPDGFRGWSGGARGLVPDLALRGDPRLPRRPGARGPLARPARPLLVAATGLHWRAHGHPSLRPAGPKFEPRPAPRAVAGHRTPVVPRRPARPLGALRRPATRSRRCSTPPEGPASTSSPPPTTTPPRPGSTGAGTCPTTTWSSTARR